MLFSTAASASRLVCWRCALSSSRPALPKSALSLKQIPRSYKRYVTAAAAGSEAPIDLAHTRNIGIIAHIDAGKTTTTERMLYYSGFTRNIGEVDEGSTVMDYLPAERQRGITITSAAITFNWTPPSDQKHVINLIDTPGHADFTFEVERSIRVLDGAVTILDGVAGVEAQTEKVWRQAAKQNIPRLIFVNKLDRIGARFGATVREVAAKLNGWPAVLQLPLYENDGKGGEDVLRGIVDVVENRVFLYEVGGDGQNITLKDYAWLQETYPALYEEALAARVALVELLTTHDDVLVEEFLEAEDHHAISASSIKRSIRTLTLPGAGQIIPTLCGASFRNIGVQPLLDAVVDYLPSPLDRPNVAITYGKGREHTAVLDPATSHVCALAFKVVNDPKRGAMVFVRVYSGVLHKATGLYNTSLHIKERAHRLLQMYADTAVDIPTIPTGHIGVIIGLKATRTGDTLVADSHATKSHKHDKDKAVDFKTMHLRPIEVPSPVFFASLEPYSISEQKNLESALSMLLREDPSLHVATDSDSGQTLLSGMGELHLEIARDRLVGDLKAKAEMGSILIAYRETISSDSGEHTQTYTRDGGGGSATVTAQVTPADETSNSPSSDGNSITISIDPVLPTSSNLAPDVITAALHSGVTAALSRGPHLGLPLRDVVANIYLPPQPPSDATPAVLSTAARLATIAALAAGKPAQLVEPVMRVVVSTDESTLGKVVSDISSARGGHVLSLGDDSDSGAVRDGERIRVEEVWVPRTGDVAAVGETRGGERKREVVARVPLGEMVGYLKHLRAATQGRGTFVMELDGWERMQGPRAGRVEAEIKGV